MNRTIRRYKSFTNFYGMEGTIEHIVSFLRHASQGLEERKQILYLLGPVGGGKSSLAERLKALMEVHPIYVLKAGRSEEHTSELQSLMRKSYAVFCLQKKKNQRNREYININKNSKNTHI